MTDFDDNSLQSGAGTTPSDKADELLEKVEKTRRGHLKFFFGAAPGVGKTYAMLQEAKEKRNEGLAVLIGWVDTHNRKDTMALLEGLDVLPRKKIRHNNFSYEEFDIDEVLKRRPALVVVDELAHTNAPGSRHQKRWQDVEELLAAGIDVYTAMNVQHLESLNGVVEKITGVEVNETVPDRLFEDADEVRLVDLPPNDLIARLRAGKIYIRETVDAALHGFFKKSNLHALRELALRKMALRVVETDRVRGEVNPGAVTVSGLLLYIDCAENAQALVRECSRLTYSMQLPWYAVWVDNGKSDEDDRAKINEALKLAEELGGNAQIIESFSVAPALASFAKTKDLHTIVSTNEAVGFRLRRHLMKSIPDLHLMMLSLPGVKDAQTAKKNIFSTWVEEFKGDGWWQSIALVAILTVFLSALDGTVKTDTLALFYIFPTLLMALRYGTGAATLCVALSAIVFDIYFIEPKLSLAIADFNYVVLLVVMLCVGLGAGTLIAKLKRLSVVSTHRSAQMQMLLAMSKELGRAMDLSEIAETLTKHINDCRFDVKAELWECLDNLNELNRVGARTANVDHAVAMWCVEHGDEAGCGTNTLSSAPYLYVPLKGSIRVRGVIVFIADDESVLHDLEFKRLARAVADLVALAMERLHYVEVSQKTAVEMEAQHFRHMLINELSHDLRTPLTVLSGSAEVLNRKLQSQKLPEAELSEELIENISKMTRLTDNLLEMARLQSGTVQLRRDWIAVQELFGTALGSMPAVILKKFHIKTVTSPECEFVYADAVLINRVIVNLLDNAMKYCPAGADITLDARTSGSKVVLSVIDNGPGLPEDSSKLFDPFKRGSKESNIAGIGLGLSISKMIARVHEGQLFASNNPNGGAKFSLVLPMHKMPELEDDDEADLPVEEDDKKPQALQS